jgi:hypothetical protein
MMHTMAEPQPGQWEQTVGSGNQIRAAIQGLLTPGR